MKHGWLAAVAVFVATAGCADPADDAGASIDQRLTTYNTVFYFGPVPTDWSVLVAG